MNRFPPEYVVARSVLLDALEAIGPQRPSLVLIGAQAVYLHTGEAVSTAVPPTTTDADLAIDIAMLDDAPLLDESLRNAGFTVTSPGVPGHWVAGNQVSIDLMVPTHMSGRAKTGARRASLPPHGEGTARVTAGIAPALVDWQSRRIDALDSTDKRAFDLRVAGPAALVTAKSLKLAERHSTRREHAKDALDLFRLLAAVDAAEMSAGFERHLGEPTAAEESQRAIDFLTIEGRPPTGFLLDLVARAGGGGRRDEIAFAALVAELVASVTPLLRRRDSASE